MLAGVFQWGYNVLIHSSNPLGGLFIPCAFGLDCNRIQLHFTLAIPYFYKVSTVVFYIFSLFLHKEVTLVFRLHGFWGFLPFRLALLFARFVIKIWRYREKLLQVCSSLFLFPLVSWLLLSQVFLLRVILL